MKKSLVILLLMALSFVGNAQEKAATEYKWYSFEYRIEPMRATVQPSAVLWYHKMDLYIDGKYERTFCIGNRMDMPLAAGFSVPVGSSWFLAGVETVAYKGYYQINIGVGYDGFGRAEDSGNGVVIVNLSGIF